MIIAVYNIGYITIIYIELHVYKTNTTGYRGVSKGKKNTFRARISIGNSQQKLIGTFDTAIQAALAYDQAAIKAGKIKSTLNFPNGLKLLIKWKDFYLKMKND